MCLSLKLKSIDQCVCFHDNTTLFYLKSGMVIPLTFFKKLLFRIVVLILFLYVCFHMRLKTFFYFCDELYWDFDEDCVEFVDCFL